MYNAEWNMLYDFRNPVVNLINKAYNVLLHFKIALKDLKHWRQRK